MIHIIPIIRLVRLLRKPIAWLRRRRPLAGNVALLPIAVACLALSACNDKENQKTAPPVTVIETKPVGAGLTVIGFAIVGASVVVVLGRLLR